MSVTHLSHRDSHVTVTHLSRVSHSPQRSVPPTRPDPTHSSMAAVVFSSSINQVQIVKAVEGQTAPLGFGATR